MGNFDDFTFLWQFENSDGPRRQTEYRRRWGAFSLGPSSGFAWFLDHSSRFYLCEDCRPNYNREKFMTTLARASQIWLYYSLCDWKCAITCSCSNSVRSKSCSVGSSFYPMFYGTRKVLRREPTKLGIQKGNLGQDFQGYWRTPGRCSFSMCGTFHGQNVCNSGKYGHQDLVRARWRM